MPKHVEKICNMRTLLKYAKNRQSDKDADSAYSRLFLTCLPNSAAHCR